MSKRVLIVDALNMYYRAYIVDPSLSANGQPIGGLKGFLKILQKLCREIRPDHIFIAWDGGSNRRKIVNKEYKEGRKPIRLNRDIRNLSENEELQNKIWQQTRLIEFLNMMPITQSMIEGLEADDIIAVACRSHLFDGWQKVIVSADKDFIQLCDQSTVLFRPVQKEVLNEKRILEQYSIHPNNFALARAICGDKSDNLPGVGGVGLKTVSKRFPFFADEESYDVSTVIDFCNGVEEKLKVHERIMENRDLIEKNYKMMQLYFPSISMQSKEKIKWAIANTEMSLNKTAIRAMMIQDGFGAFDWSSLFQTLQRIIVNKQGT